MKKINLILALSLVFAAIPAHADNLLFSCKAKNNKIIKVVQTGRNLQYSYGLKNKPEIVLTIPRNQVVIHRWNGMGSSDQDSMVFENGAYTYELFSGVRKFTKNGMADGELYAGVDVSLNGENINTLWCRSNIVDNFRD